MSLEIPDLVHALGNHLSTIGIIAGYLKDRIKDSKELPDSSIQELIKSLKDIEAKVQAASGEMQKIKDELTSRGQYT